jgi:hypothetical protein
MTDESVIKSENFSVNIYKNTIPKNVNTKNTASLGMHPNTVN